MRIEARGLTFDGYVDGPADGQPVLLLHGFPQDHREWAGVLPRLHAAGLRTYAYDQRGYSAGARPPAVADYRLTEATADAVAVLDALGLDSAHVVGHDWGALVAWRLAAQHPDRIRTLSALAVPHPGAMAEVARVDRLQRLRFAYMPLFRKPYAERLLLAGNGVLLRAMMGPIGAERAAGYATSMREPGRLTAALNWYRAQSPDDPIGPVAAPTTFVWGDADPIVRRAMAEATASYVTGDYRLAVLPGVGHWLPEEAPVALADAVLARITTAGSD
jgi:pimeloyl-ACP methyl ester carboxylesterase